MRGLTCSLIMHPTPHVAPISTWLGALSSEAARIRARSRAGEIIRTGAIYFTIYLQTWESLWSFLTLTSEFYNTLGETLATSLVTPTIVSFLSYKVENWLVFYQVEVPPDNKPTLAHSALLSWLGCHLPRLVAAWGSGLLV